VAAWHPKGVVDVSLAVSSFSTLKRVEKESELLPLPVRKVYFSNPKRSSGNALVSTSYENNHHFPKKSMLF
jgi:hypothetical protein